MSWSTALDYAKANFDKKFNHTPLPLKAEIGSTITFPTNIFVNTLVNNQLIEKPSPSENIVTAIGKLSYEHLDNLKIHKFYLNTDPVSEKFIQVTETLQGEIIEASYCAIFHEFVPDTEEAQTLFMGQNGEGLGESTFTLGNDLLSRFNKKAVSDFFGDQESIEYQRDSNAPPDIFVKPYIGHEIRADNKERTQGLEKKIYHMPYYRVLPNNDKEFLLIFTEIIENVNFDKTKQALYVKMFFSIPININSLKIF
jgi:hypothetical protein